MVPEAHNTTLAMARRQAISGLLAVMAPGSGKAIASLERLPTRPDQAGALVIYAVQPNATASDGPPGGNSPFVSAFLAELQASPGAAIDSLVPAINRRLHFGTEGRQRAMAVNTLDDAVRLGGPGQRFLSVAAARYPHLAALANPPRDADAIAATLRQRGLLPISEQPLLDPTRQALWDVLDRLRQASAPGDIAVIYLAGYGLNLDGEDYFLPVDAQTESMRGIRQSSIAVNAVVKHMTEAGIRLLLLVDASRDASLLAPAIR